MILKAGLGLGAFLILLVVVRILQKRRKNKIDPNNFMERWVALQKNCVSRKTWPQAIIEADALLDEGLRKKGFKGKTTGERLVAAQRVMTNNEAVWFGHKYCQTVPDKDVRRLRKQDVLESLHGFRQALRDIGALEVPEVSND